LLAILKRQTGEQSFEKQTEMKIRTKKKQRRIKTLGVGLHRTMTESYEVNDKWTPMRSINNTACALMSQAGTSTTQHTP
jgi:hypothetical protein